MRLLFKWNDWPALHGAVHSSHAHAHTHSYKLQGQSICSAEGSLHWTLWLWDRKVPNTLSTDGWEAERRHRKGQHHTTEAVNISLICTDINKDLWFPVLCSSVKPCLILYSSKLTVHLCSASPNKQRPLKEIPLELPFLLGYKTDLMRQVSYSWLQTSWAAATADLVKLENTKYSPSPHLFVLDTHN